MKIRCKHCGEYFLPCSDTVGLMSEGYISPFDVIICDDCWDIIEHLQDDISEMFSDSDPGL